MAHDEKRLKTSNLSLPASVAGPALSMILSYVAAKRHATAMVTDPCFVLGT